THLLIRTTSFQAFGVSTTPRASSGLPSHSRGYSLQNSTQPIGARALAPRPMNSGRSLAACAVGIVSAVASIAAAAHPAAISLVQLTCIPVTPSLYRGHISHKTFASPLNRPSNFEDNQSKIGN